MSRVLHSIFVLILVGIVNGCGCAPDPAEEARRLHEAGRYGASIPILQDLIDAEPDNPEAHYLHGVALRRSGSPERALWSLRKASEHADWALVAGLEFATSAREAQNLEAAIEAAGELLRLEPDNVQAHSLRGQAYFEGKKFEEALADFEHVLALDPSNLSIQVNRVAALLGLQRVDEAEQAIAALEQDVEGASAGAADVASLCIVKATFARERGQAEVAETLLEDCLARFPDHAGVIEAAVGHFDASGRPGRSASLLRHVIDRNPEGIGYRNDLSHRLRAAGQNAEAEAILREATELDSLAVQVAAWSSLADHFMATGDFEGAALAFGHAIEREHEPSQEQLLAHADLLAMAGQYDRALEVAEGLDQEIFRDLVHARIFLEKREPERALDRLSAALRLWPNNVVARYHAAQAAERVGDFDRAIEEYRAAVRSDARATGAGLRLALLYEAKGAREEALAAAAHHLNGHPDDAEALLLLLRVNARAGRASGVQSALTRLRDPRDQSRALGILADAAADRLGAARAVELIRSDSGVDLTDPRFASALHALIRHSVASGEPAAALSAARESLAAHPDAPEFHVAHGLALEALPERRPDARGAFERAVELDPEHADALRALARLVAEAGDHEAALAYYARAAAAGADPVAALRGEADSLAALGRSREAESKLEELLWEDPAEARAALRLAQLRVARGAAPAGTRELARRSVLFGGGIEAEKLLGRLDGDDAGAP